MHEKDIKKIEEVFKHHIGILSENIQHKLNNVIEAQQTLIKKMDDLLQSAQSKDK